MNAPYTPIPRVVSGDDTQMLMSKLAGMPWSAGTARVDLITTSRLRVSLIDTGTEPEPVRTEGDTIIHILAQAIEHDATITVDAESFPIAPGDTMTMPEGESWQLSPHQLAIVVVRRTRSLGVPIGPTHGQESYAGYNRRTAYPTGRGVNMVRWKLTQPWALTPEAETILVGLANPIALQWRNGVDLIRPGECRVIDQSLGELTIHPDGLGYVLVIETA